jgi:hypothetical protein
MKETLHCKRLMTRENKITNDYLLEEMQQHIRDNADVSVAFSDYDAQYYWSPVTNKRVSTRNQRDWILIGTVTSPVGGSRGTSYFDWMTANAVCSPRRGGVRGFRCVHALCMEKGRLRWSSSRCARGDGPPRDGIRAHPVLLRVVTRVLRACSGLRAHPPFRRARCLSCTDVKARLSWVRGRTVPDRPVLRLHRTHSRWGDKPATLRCAMVPVFCDRGAPMGQRYSNRTESGPRVDLEVRADRHRSGSDADLEVRVGRHRR